MNDQENLEEGLDFDLDSILSEFGSGAQSQETEDPQKEPEAPEATQESETDLPDLSGFDLPDLDLPAAQAPQAEEEPSAPPVSDEALSDEEFAKQLDALLGDSPSETPEATQSEGDLEDTQVFSPVSESPKEAQDDTAATQRLDTVSQIPQPDTPPEPKKEPIPFRANLQELKRKLVAGPEKRYYELSDQGVLKLQIAILLNLLVVGVCAATAAMFSMGLVPENRLRLVIFSQILGMLVSALLGSYQMLDGVADLLHGKFTINFMLVLTFLACGADSIFCLKELRVPCCAGFALEMTFALLARLHRRATEMSQMDTLRRAIRLNSIVKEGDYLDGSVLLRGEGDVDDFLDTYNKPGTPEKLQGAYCFLALIACIALSALAFLRLGTSFALRMLSTSLLAAVPASFFIAITRPAALLEHRLHMVGSVLCGWQGVVKLRGKAYFPRALPSSTA